MRATAQELFAEFGEQVLSFNARASTAYAQVVCERDQLGLPIDGFDAQIAAVCRTYGASVATRNVRDFYATGIEVIDPWR